MNVKPVSSKKDETGGSSIRGKAEGKALDITPMNKVVRMEGHSRLLEASREYWSNPRVSQDERKTFIDGIQSSYQILLDEFIYTADACVDQNNFLERLNKRWRWIVIIGTGVVATINILAANIVTGAVAESRVAEIFSVTAAVAAAVLTVLANLENFTGAQRRAQGFRQARERFLDASRDYQQLWNTYVNPFYPRAEACVNSIILIRLLTEKDRELRDRLIELTRPKGQES